MATCSVLRRVTHGTAKFRRRGWDCSERFTPGSVPDVDVLTDDILAVMSEVRSEQVAVLATYESAIVASLFAAVYPERTKTLILVDPQVTYLPTDETPWMPALSRWQKQIELVRDTWGTTDWWDAPHGDEGEWFSRYARASVTPGGLAAELDSYLETDVRAVLPSIQVPTLVLVDTDSFYEVLPETGRFVATKIPGARIVEHSSQGGHRFHWYARADAIVDEVGRFLAAIREEDESFDRVLATVLFTDIVGSTERAAALGDRRWREVVEQHHSAIRTLLARYRGRRGGYGRRRVLRFLRGPSTGRPLRDGDRRRGPAARNRGAGRTAYGGNGTP